LLMQLIFVLLLNIALTFTFFNYIQVIEQVTNYKVLRDFTFATMFSK